MALTAKKVYAILKRQISDMEAKLNSPVRYRGTVATADLLPLNPDIGDMYNIESKSIYGEAGMNVAWNGVVWDTMGAPIDMSLYLTKEEAETVIQRLVTEYFEKNPVKPGGTTEQTQQIEQNKTDIASLKTETGSLKEDKADKTSLAQTDRKLDALWKLNQGISYEFQTDEAEAYQKTVPSGTKMASVKQIGGKTIVWNQYSKELGTETGWAYLPVNTSYYKELNGHVVYIKYKTIVKEIKKQAELYKRRLLVLSSETGERIEIGSEEVRASIFAIGRTMETKEIRTMPKNITGILAYNYGDDKNATSAICDTWINIFDLTKMFGAGNEPSTPEEFEAMFPADYYSYNAGELMSAPVNEVMYLDTKNQETSYPIPQAVLNLPGYGWSAGDARNEVNWENKQYIQRVDKVDLGTLKWIESGDAQRDGNATYKSGSLNTVIRRYSTYSGNSICEKFNIVKVNDINRNEYEYSIGNSEMAYPLQFTVKSTFCTDKNDFKNKINGIMLYYELAEPIVSDISDIIGTTFQEPLEVEAGGTLTFRNSHGDAYRIPVPSTEEYLVSLAEVAK